MKILFFWWSIFVFLIAEMVACIKYEDRLDGMSNYLQWKVRMTVVLKENRLWTIISTVVTPPADTDPIALDIHEVKEAKAQRLILDGIKDHLIPLVAEKKIAYNMWTTLKGLYEDKNENRIMALKEKLQGTKMAKGEGVVYFFYPGGPSER